MDRHTEVLKHAELIKNLALYRLAARELQNISGSAEMFFSNAAHNGEGERIRQLSNELAKLQVKADRLHRKLEQDLLPFESIEVSEIY